MREVHVFEGRPDDCRQVVEEKMAKGYEILHLQSFMGTASHAISVVYFVRDN